MSCEKELAQAWREGLWLGKECNTTEGQSFRVIYSGYSGLSWGPDFRRAAILQEGKKVKGDVEFHGRSSQWVEHGHHRDLAYNNVILHVVWDDDRPGATLTSCGDRVPVFEAGGLLRNVSSGFLLPCCNRRTTPPELKKLLALQGNLWFLAKASLAYRAFETVQPEEALYRGIFQALGYSENKAPFYKLACSLPFDRLRKQASNLKEKERLDYIKNLFFSSSGLFYQGACSFISSSTKASYSGSPYIAAGSLKGSEWRLYGLRPANHPVRRLAAAAYLAARYLDGGLVSSLAQRIIELKPGDLYPHKLLVVEESPEPSLSYRKASLLGEGRALLIVVNIILPFAYALAKKEGNSKFRRRALDLFQRCPGTGDNIIIKHFRRLWGLPLKLKAREEQGLLRLEKAYCSQGRCGQCPIIHHRLTAGWAWHPENSHPVLPF